MQTMLRKAQDAHRPTDSGWLIRARWLRMLSITVALSCGAAIAQETQQPTLLEQTKTTLEKWVETNRLISKEKKDWRLGKEVLGLTIELKQQEIETLEQRIADAEKNISESDQKKLELDGQNEELKAVSKALVDRVAGLEARVKNLLLRLPAPVVERVKMISQTIPEDPNDTEVALGVRFRNVIFVLNEVNKFNRELTVVSEVRDLADGRTAEVTTLYVGIGQAYYVSNGGDAAGIGTAGPDGWVWQPMDAAAPAIAKAVAILQNEEQAAFVQLPLRIPGDN